ncbi:hypothetical protein [Arcticibacterium luteifluviistationis]|uniref:Outer membrane protein beta-barrel domain-containing protein n=1 Tax=Arcticibacterium luteifluviistationis TaxID=1784714 RepID=A0A2Z4G7X6_9BACT|nr:hypothetical protein [Arcticibacterium luteifluviistationis]AWV97205.1 hypothetical protein DJ013_03075 [Arcticibacterium luteifluviistationis]
MKKSFFLGIIAMLLISLDSTAQYNNNIAVGLKIGEPIGLNIRKYFQYGDKTFDINIGSYGLLYGQHRKYRDGPYHLKNSNGKYTSSQPAGMMFQGIYSWHRPVGKGDAIKVYYGFGGQVNYRTYVSKDNLIGTNQNGEKHVSMGPTGNAGIEYNLPGNDVGIFLDAGGYVEIVPDLLFMHPQLSAGVRVNIVRGK